MAGWPKKNKTASFKFKIKFTKLSLLIGGISNYFQYFQLLVLWNRGDKDK